MSDPNFPSQQYPNPSQSQRAQYDQPRQQVSQLVSDLLAFSSIL